MNFQRGLVAVAAFIVAEIAVIVTFTTKERPGRGTLATPTITARIAAESSAETTLRLSAQAADSTVVAFQIEWGDGHESQVDVGCGASSSAPKYGGETVTASARHPHAAGASPRVRAVARSCIAGIPGQQVSAWRDALRPLGTGNGAR